MKNQDQGFTLIELLVVITIIGLLASIVLASLSSARNKGNDSAIISDVQQLRNLFESNRLGTGSYPDLSNTTGWVVLTPGSSTLINSAISDTAAKGGGLLIKTAGSGATTNAFALYGQLKSDPTRYFCLDNVGKSNQSTTNTSGTSCP